MAKHQTKAQGQKPAEMPAETTTPAPSQTAEQALAAEKATADTGENREQQPAEMPAETTTPAPSQTAEQAPATETATADSGESREQQPAEAKQQAKADTSPSVGWVNAELKQRWASGGRPHEAGETVRMSRGTYERLKKYGRVE